VGTRRPQQNRNGRDDLHLDALEHSRTKETMNVSTVDGCQTKKTLRFFCAARKERVFTPVVQSHLINYYHHASEMYGGQPRDYQYLD
jgi:hypothetical protein